MKISHIHEIFFQNQSAVLYWVDRFFLSVSRDHTALYLVKNYGDYQLLGQTLDDAAGKAFDKIAKLMNLPYPGGPVIEKLAQKAKFRDFFTIQGQWKGA